MSLKTDTFPAKKHWLSTGLKVVPANPKIFSKDALNEARKAFLAGSNQLTAIRNWMEGADLIASNGREYKLGSLGVSMSDKDPELNTALSWWLVHIHLCLSESFPYCAFFTSFDVDGNWMTPAEVEEALCAINKRLGFDLADDTIANYFAGVDASFRPGHMLYMLGLIERRESRREGTTALMIRRTSVRPSRELIVYTALLLHRHRFKGQATVATPELLKCGFARILGMRDTELRDQLNEMRHDKECSSLIEYTRKQDLDSIHFRRQGSAPLGDLREYCYNSGAVKWK